MSLRILTIALISLIFLGCSTRFWIEKDENKDTKITITIPVAI